MPQRTLCHAKVLQFFGLLLKIEPTASCSFVTWSDVSEVNWGARTLLRPASVPTNTFGTLQKQWWSLLMPQCTVCHAKVLNSCGHFLKIEPTASF